MDIGAIVGPADDTASSSTRNYGTGSLTATGTSAYLGTVVGHIRYVATAADAHCDTQTTGTSFTAGSSDGGTDMTGATGLTSTRMRYSSIFTDRDITGVRSYDHGECHNSAHFNYDASGRPVR